MSRLKGVTPELKLLLLAVFCCCLLLIGTAFGAAAASGLPVEYREFIGSRIVTAAFTSDSGGEQVFGRALVSNLRTGLLLLIAGMTVIGVPASVGIVFGRGFVAGFAAGLFTIEFGIRGAVLALVSLFPPALFWVPAVVGLGTASLWYGTTVGSRSSDLPWGRFVTRYAVLSSCFILLLCVAALVEGFVCPPVLRAAIPLLVRR